MPGEPPTEAPYRHALDRLRDRDPLAAATVDRHVHALAREVDRLRRAARQDVARQDERP